MRLKFIYIILIFISFKGFSQPKSNITLPKGGDLMKFNSITGLYSIYITKNQEVYIDDRKLEYFQDINYTYFNQLYKNSSFGFPRVLLYADVDTPYRFISEVKDYIPSCLRIFHMTDNIDDLKAAPFTNCARYNELVLEEIYTLEEEISIQKLNDSLGPPPLPPPSMWYFNFAETMYSGNKEAINQALKKYSYTVLTVSTGKKLKLNNVLINQESLKKALKSNNIIFLKFDNKALYQDYISAIQLINKCLLELEKLDENSAFVLEFSNYLGKLFKSLEIKLNQD